MKNTALQAHPPAPVPHGKLTLCDVLEAEFIEISNEGHDIADEKYKELKKAHLAVMEELDKLSETLAQTDPEFKKQQEHCDHLEKPRLARLIEIMRSKERSALCFSGGGIRSATFGLGVLQGLSHHHLLSKFDYLSTVSGGGYIGSWLSAWRKRLHDEYVKRTARKPPVPEIEEIERSLKAKPAKKLDGERPEIEHLRSYSNYLTPRFGFFTVDTWTLVATVIRNMFLNWMILVPLLAALLLLPKLALEMVKGIPDANWVTDGSPAVPAPFVDWSRAWPFMAFHSPFAEWSPWLWLLVAVLVGGFLLAVLALFYIARYLPSAGGTNCSQKRYLWSVLVPLCLSAILISTFWAGWQKPDGKLPLYAFVGFGAALHVCGWLAYGLGLLVGVLTGHSSANPAGAKSSRFAALLDQLKQRAPSATLKGAFAYMQATAPTPSMPRGGAKQVAIGATVALAALLIWLLAAGVTGGFGGWIAWVVTENLSAKEAGLVTCFGFPLVMGVYFFTTVLLIGLTSTKTSDEDREWWARSGAWILIVSVVWLIGSVLVVYGPHWVDRLGTWIFGTGGLAGIGGSLVGRSAQTGAAKSDSKGDAAKSGVNPDAFNLFSTKTLLSVVGTVAPLVFLMALLLAISALADRFAGEKVVGWIKQYTHLPHWLNPRPLAVFALMLAAGALAWVMAKFVNVNTFSLHAMYRARLIRAYLGAARTEERKPEATLNLFTGFDPRDNFPIAHLPPGRPFHILNMCLNLVHGERLAWQERKAETFTVSRLHSGSARIGYQRSNTYGNAPGKHDSEADRVQNEGITLGTAMAISGAAASPNMGYHSSPLLAFLMTFFNARLGWWLANPDYPGRKYWSDRGPKSAINSLIAEALGNTDDRNPYVYLSDGGHFENLGLYEMVLRRCDTIVVIDAGADPRYQFEDLANAIRKIRVDLGVSIHFDKPVDMHRGLAPGNVHCAKADIYYDCIDGSDPHPEAGHPETHKETHEHTQHEAHKGTHKKTHQGTLIYIKPVLDSSLSVDLDQYHSAHPDFPQQPTADQWFDESQFESYRRLGVETIDNICERLSRKKMTVTDFVDEAMDHSKSATKKPRKQC